MAESLVKKTARSFEEILEENGSFVYTNVGDSMWPLIRQGKDLIVISRKPEGRLKRYDVPLYRRDSDRLAGNRKYVLHRVLCVRSHDYVIAGDNRWRPETGISDRNVVGILTAVIRGGAVPGNEKTRTVSTTDLSYRLYTHLWCDLFPIRVLIFWIRAIFFRAIRSVRRAKKSRLS